MPSIRIGVVHPGNMGIFVAATLQNSGHTVCWASEGRSKATISRARERNLQDTGKLTSLCEQSELVVSVCPPHSALAVAQQVAENGFRGKYIDANAISPMKSIAINELMQRAGIDFIDGGIIGPPAWHNSSTRLYLSGPNAQECQRFFNAGPLQATVLSEKIGEASALKLCYAAYTKGTSALFAAILALAENHQVKSALTARWEEDWPGLPASAESRIRRAASKAWRFSGEMEEIAETFAEAGLPNYFHLGASQVYKQLADFKNCDSQPTLDEILDRLLTS